MTQAIQTKRRRRYETWEVRSYRRRVTDWTDDGQRFNVGGYERVVTIFDPAGWVWEVTLTDDLTELATLNIAGGVIDQNAMRAVPLSYLRDVAADHLRRIAGLRGDGLTGADAAAIAAVDPGEVARRGDPPTPESFAALWHATPATSFVDGKRITRRHALAAHYGVTVWAIDKYARAARDAGALPPARKRATKTKTTPKRKGQ